MDTPTTTTVSSRADSNSLQLRGGQLAGTLSGVEMGLALAGVPHRSGGVGAALDFLRSAPRVPAD